MLCLASTSRLALVVPRTTALPLSSSFIASRSIHAPAAVDAAKRVPRPRGAYDSPAAILSASKRKTIEGLGEKVGEWTDLFSKTAVEWRDAGLNVKDSRYLLWLLEKYRQGHDPKKVAVAPTPPKTIRGWGDKVQNGVRIR